MSRRGPDATTTTAALASLRYRVGVAVPVPTGVIVEIERRFGPVAVRVTRGRRVTLHGSLMDQAALRGLLTLLWDVNAEVISVRIAPSG